MNCKSFIFITGGKLSYQFIEVFLDVEIYTGLLFGVKGPSIRLICPKYAQEHTVP